MRKWILLVSLSLLFASTSFADTVISENFNSVASLAGSGWAIVNNSSAGGSTSWFQGNTGIFDAQSGAADSYIAANFLAAGAGGNISDWLILPEINLSGGVTLTFYTRTEADSVFPDRLEVRLSANGASTDVGTTDNSVGDFSTLLLTLNPALALGGYPEDWTAYTVSLNGDSFAPGTQGRLAFRYNVTDTNTNADYIGIDSVNVKTPEPASLALLTFGLAAIGVRKLRRRVV